MKRTTIFALAAMFAIGTLAIGPSALAHSDKYKAKKSTKKKSSGSSSGGFVGRSSATSGAENGLAGIKIYDSGLRVIALYGNPDTITAVGVGGAAAGGGDGGQGGPPGGAGGRGGGGGNPGGGGGPRPPATDQMTPPNGSSIFPSATLGDEASWLPVDDSQLDRRFQGATPQAPAGLGTPGGGGGQQGRGAAGPPPGVGGAPGGAGAGAGSNTASESTVFTRWNYTKNGTKLSFIIDKFNRVLQIEALGLENGKIQTKRGVGFGSTFATVMNRYAPSNDPDGYDLAGNHFTVRFLTRTRVAFRLTQLSTKKAHVVTGIVVSAGKK